MGGGSKMFQAVTESSGRDKEAEDKIYKDRRRRSDTARDNVKAGLDRGVNFQPINLDEFAQNKRNQAINERSRNRGIRENKAQAREDYYRRQMKEKRRENEMRKPKQEMGGIGVLGGQNPYGNDAVWDNETRSWAPNPKKNMGEEYKKRSEVVNQGQTNIFGQSQGIAFGPGSSARGTIKQEPQADNRDFKKLYEELLKITEGRK